MAELEMIQVQLSNFNKLQILRDTLEDLEEQKRKLDLDLRAKLELVEVQRYVESISPWFAHHRPEHLPTGEQMQYLLNERQQLWQVMQVVEQQLNALIGQTGVAAADGAAGAGAAPAADGDRPRKKINFSDF